MLAAGMLPIYSKTMALLHLYKTMNINLPIELVNQILGYLGSRPYQEVFHFVQTVQNLAKEQMPPTAPEDTA